jgi:16S rRNA U516 pseudouridylate synthase RsuA-like enzyme
VRVRGVPDAHDLERLSKGISLEGRRTAPAEVELKKIIEAESGQQALLAFVINEGRNRQVRNMCDAIGHPVVRLRRVRIGPITDEHIRPGEFRDLTPAEVAQLERAVTKGTAQGNKAPGRRTPGKEAPRSKGAPPRSESAARSRPRRAGDRPRRG